MPRQKKTIPHTTKPSASAKKGKKKKAPKVDPITGKSSKAENAIPYSRYWGRVKVDPNTGKPSNAEGAISRNKYIDMKRNRVDPETGKPTNAEDAIPRTTYLARKIADPISSKPSDAENAIPPSTYYYRKRKIASATSNTGDAIPICTSQKPRNKRRRLDETLETSQENHNLTNQFATQEQTQTIEWMPTFFSQSDTTYPSYNQRYENEEQTCDFDVDAFLNFAISEADDQPISSMPLQAMSEDDLIDIEKFLDDMLSQEENLSILEESTSLSL